MYQQGRKRKQVKDEVVQFANETSILGVKELCAGDFIIGLRIVWGIFLLVCLCIMLKQMVVACASYYDERTVTNVEVEKVHGQFESVIDVCLQVSSLTNNVQEPTQNFGLYVGRLFIGLSVFYNVPHLWLEVADYQVNETFSLYQFANINTKQDTIDDVRKPPSQRIDEILQNFQINKISPSHSDSVGWNGVNPEAWCRLAKLTFNRTQKTSKLNPDFHFDIVSGSDQELAISLYSISTNPFIPVSANLNIMSSAKAKRVQFLREHYGDHVVPSAVANFGYKRQEPAYPFYNVKSYFHIHATKFIIQNLRRRPCTQVEPDIMLEAGKSTDACVASCTLQIIRDRYNCSFEDHYDIFDSRSMQKCHWFSIFAKFRDEMLNACKFQGEITDTLQAKYLPKELFSNNEDYGYGEGDYNDGTKYGSFCDFELTPDKWSHVIAYMVHKDIVDRSNYCYDKCSIFKACVEWKFDYVHEKTNTFHHSHPNEHLQIYAIKPYIVTVFEESLQQTAADLIGNIGGIFGFYFGFSLVSIIHIVFFIAHRRVKSRKEKKAALQKAMLHKTIIYVQTETE